MNRKKIIKIVLIILGVLLAIAGIIFLYIYNLINKINYKDFSKNDTNKKINIEEDNFINIEEDEEEFDEEEHIYYSNIEQINADEIQWIIPQSREKDKNIINILLLGVEAIGGGRGRTDCMIIATINKNEKTLKLTSLMRDLYVQIPGYENNKLNSVYGKGGVSLLTETIKLNFGVPIDGTFLVHFDSFEKIIDLLGGVDIELTKKEANYLNSTNYISKKENRKLKEGMNHLNGNQALGYARIRKINGLYGHSDFGRTGRQRAILNSIFNAYKEKSLLELISIAEEVLPLITTDLEKTEIIKLLTTAVNLNINEIEQLRIPIDNHYKSLSDKNYILVPDWEVNIKVLHEFIYGKEESKEIN